MEDKVTIKWNEAKQAIVSLGDICSCVCTIFNNGKAKVMILDSVFVSEPYRGQGYGQKLMEKIINFAKTQNIDSVELQVNKNNEAAIRLYEKNQFQKTDKYYYRLILNKWTT